MPDLMARGAEPHQNWRHPLPAGPVTLGRLPQKSAWATPWDPQVSSLHATLVWRQGKLYVQRAPAARNSVFYQGIDQGFREFAVHVGQAFVVGGTTFTLVESAPSSVQADLTPDAELTCTREELRQFKYVDAGERIDVLAALPMVIRYSPSNEELERRVVEVLLQGMPRAEAAAVVYLKQGREGAGPELQVRVALSRDPGARPLGPSKRLVADAVAVRRQSVLYRWQAQTASPSSDYTVQEGVDWAMCVPLPDDPAPGWGLYVIGSAPLALPGGPSAEDLFKGDLKFVELVSDVFGSLRQVLDLQRRQAQLGGFLSRPVLAQLALGDSEEVLRPREAEVTVLFCDLRGSCLISEQGQDNLPKLWGRVSAALDVMTSNISDLDGVIGDFQGDAAMGFWGWPLACPDRALRAARAALGIRRDFLRAAQKPDNPLAGFACGIGIASGVAFAGKLGTYDQFKVSVFGPVVNLASRLESMTKQLQVPILLDERSARLLGTGSDPWYRFRRLARVRPYGLQTALTVSELLPSEVEPGAMRERERRDYEAGLDAFLAGRWRDADRLLQHLSAGDGPARFLRNFMQQHGQAPPAGWDGVIALQSK